MKATPLCRFERDTITNHTCHPIEQDEVASQDVYQALILFDVSSQPIDIDVCQDEMIVAKTCWF